MSAEPAAEEERVIVTEDGAGLASVPPPSAYGAPDERQALAPAGRTDETVHINDAATRKRELGPIAQACVAGLYAWIVSVAPCAWSRGANSLAKGAAVIGLASLALGVALEVMDGTRAPGGGRASVWARPTILWGLVISSACVWGLVPLALHPTRLDAPRGIAAFIGWGVFAFSVAAPATGTRDAIQVVRSALEPRAKVRRSSGVVLILGTIVALSLKGIGWDVLEPERGMAVHLVTLAGSLAIVGTSAAISNSLQGERVKAPSGGRARRAIPWIGAILFLALIGAGLLLVAR